MHFAHKEAGNLKCPPPPRPPPPPPPPARGPTQHPLGTLDGALCCTGSVTTSVMCN